MGVAGESIEVAVGVREGDLLAGKYRIDKILGAGGMGVVVAAHHIRLDERVAIKFLLPEALGNAEAVARFEREARAAVKIKSEHVARVTDIGTLENGAPYIVMEYLEGGDLAAWIRQRGPLAVEQAVEFVVQACEAIADAHGLGIVHRDLKPSNLFCIRGSDDRLSIKVLDFGISKMTGGAASGPDMVMTKTKSVMGSPFYMSPEQMRSAKDVDARTDIWALGIILYELLAGQAPFTGDTLPEVCVKIATEPPPPLRNLRPDAPAGIEDVILKCLAKDRRDRYRNVAELAVALAPFGSKRLRASVERVSRVIHGAGLSTRGPVAFSSAPPSSLPQSDTGTMASWGRTASPSARKAVKVVIAALAVAAAGAAGALLFVGRAREPAPVQSLVSTAIVVSPAPVAPPVAATPAVFAPIAPIASASAAPTPSATPRPALAKPPPAPAAPAAARPRAPAKSADDWGGRL
jgi:eukaryotic-like serine/threonine-protein kinase